MAERRYTSTLDGETVSVGVEAREPGTYSVTIGDGPPELVQVLSDGGILTLLVGDQVLELAPDGGRGFAARGGVAIRVEASRRGARAHATGPRSGKVHAPMPGRIVKLLCTPGDHIDAGAGLLVMEAMKMENEIAAPHAGTVARVLVREGDTVERDAPLVELEDAVKKLKLAQLPTPLFRHEALDRLMGTEVWVKRDDLTASGAAGNKIRKLEYLVADALAHGATTLVTCGGHQSNHARATAIVAAELGLESLLLLRTTTPSEPPPVVGNLLLDYLVGAEVRFITPAEYQERDTLMALAAEGLRARGKVPYVIPEGGSNGLGSLGYVDAMAEVRAQLDAGEGGGPRAFDAVVHACGSGGTAAGVALGIRRHRVADVAHAVAVCDDRAYFEATVARITREACALDSELDVEARAVVHDAWKGPAYGLASDEQLDFVIEVARRTGLLLDPVYTGKALFGLSRLEPKPGRVLFLHTGGVPGLLAQADVLAPLVTRR